jgi:hypothetical protein
MTIFGDSIQSGSLAATSAKASHAPVQLCRTIELTGNGDAETIILPTGVENLDAKCYIVADGSAATTDSIVIDLAGTTAITFSSMGSAQGLVNQTEAAIGTKVVVCSACDIVTTTSEVSATATLTSTDAACTYRVVLLFDRVRDQVDK